MPEHLTDATLDVLADRGAIDVENVRQIKVKKGISMVYDRVFCENQGDIAI